MKVVTSTPQLTAGVSGPMLPGRSGAVTAAVPGQPMTFTFTANESAPSVSYTYAINWGGAKQTVTGGSSIMVTHVYTATGSDKVTVTVTDAVGNSSIAAATPTFNIQAIVMEQDPTDNTETALAIGSTGTIVITPTNVSATPVAVNINKVDQTLPAALQLSATSWSSARARALSTWNRRSSAIKR